MSVHKEKLQAVESLIHELRIAAKRGDESAVEGLRNIGLLSSQILERLAFDETTVENPAGGAVHAVARRSSDWPHRLAAIAEIRSGPSTGNAEKYSAFLRLGSDLGIVTEPSERGRRRDFQGKSGFVLKVIRRIREDVKNYKSLTRDELLDARYHMWSYQIDQSKPQELHEAFADYILAARELPDNASSEWADVAMMWAHVETEGNIEKDDFWPKQIYLTATQEATSVAAQLNKWFKSGIPQVMKPMDSNR